MGLSPSSKTSNEGTAGTLRIRPRRHRPAPPLDATMTCESAFRTVAVHYLADLTAHHHATCGGDAEALHQMRLALTRLKTAMIFFSPMVAGPHQRRLREELKWLNAHLGIVRDLDVAIERLKEVKPRPAAEYRSWTRQRAETQRQLARALGSARYRRLISDLSRWIEAGSWSTKRGTQATSRRACPIAEYSARKLERWREKLIKRSRKLHEIGAAKRHRLRLMNKRLSYATEAIFGLILADENSRLQPTLKALRKAQRSLGELNDDARCQSLATTLDRGGVGVSPMFLGPRGEKRLVRAAAAAYQKLAGLKPLRL